MFDGEATPAGTEEFTADVAARTAPLYERVRSVIPDFEWPAFAPDIDAILRLKRERNAVILAHNYQTPEIFHCVADIVGDSLALAREAAKADADVIVLAGVHFMAETAKLLNPDKTVLIPDLRAGCSLAESITAADVRLLRQRYPGRAGRDLRQHLGRGEGRVRHLLHLGQCGEGGRVARRRPGASCCPTSIWRKYVAAADRGRDHRLDGPLRGARALHRRRDPRAARRSIPASWCSPIRNARPRCVAEADFAGSTAAMVDYVGDPRAAARGADHRMLDERQRRRRSIPDVEFVRPCNLCPHMKRITLAEYPPRAGDDAARGRRSTPRSPPRAPRRRAHAGRRMRPPRRRSRRPRPAAAGHRRRRPRRADDGACSWRRAPVRRADQGAARRRTRSSAWAQGGIAAAVGPDDDPACTPPTRSPPATGCATRPSSRRITARRAGRDRRAGRAAASPSTATPDGSFALGLEAAHSRRRIVHAGGDGTGARDHARAGRRGARARPRSPCWKASRRGA